MIVYTDATGNQRKYTDKPDFEKYDRHYCFGEVGYDPDFDAPHEDEDELKCIICEYGEKVLFAGGAWQAAYIGDMLSARVYKCMDDYWR